MAEDEEENIVVEFEGNFDFEGIRGRELSILGLDSEEPIMKIDSRYYKIDINNSIGTRLIFNQSEEKKLNLYTKTDKLMKAKRVLIKPK